MVKKKIVEEVKVVEEIKEAVPPVVVAEEKVEVKKEEIKKEEIKKEETKPPVSAAAETTPLENGGLKSGTNRVMIAPTKTIQAEAPSRAVYQAPMPKINIAPPAPPVSVNQSQQMELVSGALDIMPDGQGFVRPKFTPSPKDAFLASMQIRRYSLRMGDMITGVAKAPNNNEKHWSMVRIDKVNGLELASAQRRPEFKDLVPIFPIKQVKLEFDPTILSTRIIDLFSPIGFGQRGMIVSPPKAGKTTLLKEIAAGVSQNYPEVHLMAVLVGERPEEVTDMQRFIKGEVVASSFDQKPEEQTRAAEIAIERAKRLVEMGQDVFMIFDSITRLARAYNLAIPTSGRTLSGGFDPAALYPSKKFFGAARKIEGGGSLTIIGTSLVDTGSKMDDLVFEEFKGTGNMELRLERRLAERRIFPAFDILKSGTRRDDLLLTPETLERIISIRRMFDALGDREDTGEVVVEQMRKSKTNEEFLMKIGKK